MQNVSYVFVDPGTTNFGIVLMAVNGKDDIDYRKYTLCIKDGDIYEEVVILKKIIASVKAPVYLYYEENSFPQKPSFSNKLAGMIGACEATLITSFNLQSHEIFSKGIPAITLKTALGLRSDDKAKKIINQAFTTVTPFDKATLHESDAFCAGALIVLENSKDPSVGHHQDVIDICQLFWDNVSEIRKSHYPEDRSKPTEPQRAIQSRRAHTPKAHALVRSTPLKRPTGLRKIS